MPYIHSITRLLRWLGVLALGFALTQAYAGDTAPVTVRVGVLKFGTVNWGLDVMQAHALAQKYHFNLSVVPLASADAGTVALQGGAVDIIVSDWIWVTRQRAQGIPYTFAPYSNAIGSVLVKTDGPIHSVADLRGHTIGVSGGPTDKSWLMLRAYASKKLGIDLNTAASPVFAAPPLLNNLALSAQVDAVLNVWHYDARLEGHGMHALISMPELLAGLGIERPIPLIGWVFNADWAAQNHQLVSDFLAASAEANTILAQSDAEWDRLKPLMHAEDNNVFIALRNGYRSGIPVCADTDYAANVAKALHVLAEVGGERLVGKSASLEPGTFWAGYRLPTCPRK